MPMAADDIADMIRAAIPDAQVEITDLAGDGDHYAAKVVAESFPGHEPRRAAAGRLCRAGRAHGRRAPRLATDHCRPQLTAIILSAPDWRLTGMDQIMTDAVQQRIADIVNGNDVVLFMKGTPLFPQCGFSSRAIAILEHLGVAYESVDVLQDQGIRQGIKAFSDWPTIPQLYVKGEFVGGSDIMMEMYEAGELQQLMTDQGVAAAN